MTNEYNRYNLDYPEVIHTRLDDGTEGTMSLEEATQKDIPEGTITVTISATLLQQLVRQYNRKFPWLMTVEKG